jgi:hypothetical protein
MNEEPAPKSSLDLTLTQHLRDENLESWEVRARLKVNPLRTWYYNIFPHSCTVVIFLQVDPASGDEPEIVYESCYETEDISIFAQSSILGVGHYCWLCDLICQLPPNSKVNYLVHTIRHILDFLQLWTIIAT